MILCRGCVNFFLLGLTLRFVHGFVPVSKFLARINGRKTLIKFGKCTLLLIQYKSSFIVKGQIVASFMMSVKLWIQQTTHIHR